jgi:high frequency lysogenization protein
MALDPKRIDQVIALGGIAQSIRIVQNVAWRGHCNETDFKAVLASILRINAPSAASVYGGSFEISTGLRYLKQQLDPSDSNKDPEFVNLLINLIVLQKQLSRNKRLMERLEKEIHTLTEKYKLPDLFNDETVYHSLVESCSLAYKSTLSKLPNRIQVRGEPQYLKQPFNQAIIRAALLAAIRSVFLWRQLGGNRWQFLFSRRELIQAAEQLIRQPINE